MTRPKVIKARKAEARHRHGNGGNHRPGVVRKFKHQWTHEHAVTVIYRLETNVFSLIGPRAIKDIEPAELLACLRRIEARGHLELARRTKQICGQVWRYAVATGRAQRDVGADLRGAIAPPVPRNFPTIVEPARLGKLLRDMDDYAGFFVTERALRLSPIVFLRPGNLRQAEWADIDLENAVWRIDGDKMKGQKNRKRPDHITPLPVQAIQILKETRPFRAGASTCFRRGAIPADL